MAFHSESQEARALVLEEVVEVVTAVALAADQAVVLKDMVARVDMEERVVEEAIAAGEL